MNLSEAKVSTKASIKRIENGDINLLNRLVSIGLSQGTRLQVVKNDRKMPVLVFARETLLAINRRDAEKIELEVLL